MKKIMIAAAIAFAAFALRAEPDGFFMLSVFAPGQLPAASSSIWGGRLSLIYGECHELYGIDLGVSGYNRERMYGAQLNAIWNGVGTDMAGLQLGLSNFVEGDASGLQLGLVNIADHLYGCQIGLINVVMDRDWTFVPFINIGW